MTRPDLSAIMRDEFRRWIGTRPQWAGSANDLEEAFRAGYSLAAAALEAAQKQRDAMRERCAQACRKEFAANWHAAAMSAARAAERCEKAINALEA